MTDQPAPTPPTPPANHAAATYARRAADNAILINLLSIELDAHAEQTDEARVDWNRTGDIGHVRNELIETLMFISGRERLDIEQYLDQTRPSEPAPAKPADSR